MLLLAAERAAVATDQAGAGGALRARAAGARRGAGPWRWRWGGWQATDRLPEGDAIDRAARLSGHARPPAGERRGPRADRARRRDRRAARRPLRGRRGDEGGLWLARRARAQPRGAEAPGQAHLVRGARDVELDACLEALVAECVEESDGAGRAGDGAGRGWASPASAAELLSRVRRRGEHGRDLARAAATRCGPARRSTCSAQALRGALGVQEGEPLEERRDKVQRACGRARPRGRAEAGGRVPGRAQSARPSPTRTARRCAAARQDAQLMSEQMQHAPGCELPEGRDAGAPGAAGAGGPALGMTWPRVRYIDAALRELPDAPLLVLALARPEVHELFPKLWAERSAARDPAQGAVAQGERAAGAPGARRRRGRRHHRAPGAAAPRGTPSTWKS